MTYRRKRMQEIADKWGAKLNRVNQIVDQMYEKHGEGANLAEIDCPEMTEFMKIIDETIEEVRDYYVVSKEKAQRYFFDALRLRQRGKI